MRVESIRGSSRELWCVSSRVVKTRHWWVIVVCDFQNLVLELNYFEKFQVFECLKCSKIPAKSLY
jgi:hypothetical protein